MSARTKDGHDLARIVDTLMERNGGHCYLTTERIREHGLDEDTVLEWASELAFEIQPPLFTGGLYEVRRKG